MAENEWIENHNVGFEDSIIVTSSDELPDVPNEEIEETNDIADDNHTYDSYDPFTDTDDEESNEDEDSEDDSDDDDPDDDSDDDGADDDSDEKDDTLEIVDKDVIRKIKPELTPEYREQLDKKKKTKLPSFKRQEWFRYKRLGDRWRRPRGLHSKMRRHMGYRPPVVRAGYRTPKDVRYVHPSGFREVLIHNIKELENIDPKVQAVRIGGTVGKRKRKEIIEKADGLSIRVLNRRGL